MEVEDYEKFEFDIKNTIYSNILNIVGFPVAVFYIWIFSEAINKFEIPEMRILALFIFAYSTIKIIYALSNINLEYKPRK